MRRLIGATIPALFPATEEFSQHPKKLGDYPICPGVPFRPLLGHASPTRFARRRFDPSCSRSASCFSDQLQFRTAEPATSSDFARFFELENSAAGQEIAPSAAEKVFFSKASYHGHLVRFSKIRADQAFTGQSHEAHFESPSNDQVDPTEGSFAGCGADRCNHVEA